MGLQSNMQLYMLVWGDVQSIYWLKKKQKTQLYIWYDVLFRLKTWIYTIKGGLEASMTFFEY